MLELRVKHIYRAWSRLNAQILTVLRHPSGVRGHRQPVRISIVGPVTGSLPKDGSDTARVFFKVRIGEDSGGRVFWQKTHRNASPIYLFFCAADIPFNLCVSTLSRHIGSASLVLGRSPWSVSAITLHELLKPGH